MPTHNIPRRPSLSRPVAIRYCATPGCVELVEKDATGKLGRYCQKAHQLFGEEGCIACRRAEKFGASKFCDSCEKLTKVLAPMIVPVPLDHGIYTDIANQFLKSWQHPTTCPKVQAIYKIVTREDVLEKYNAYRHAVEARSGFASRGMTFGNQLRRWHGTDRHCKIGDNGKTDLCGSVHCSLCRIIKTSFDMSQAKKKTGWGRFGCGIYTSSASSKANDYSTNLVPSTWKALLLAYVAAGKSAEYTVNQPLLTQPPADFDSVRSTSSSPFKPYSDSYFLPIKKSLASLLLRGHWSLHHSAPSCSPPERTYQLTQAALAPTSLPRSGLKMSGICATPGCTDPAFKDANGRIGKYCRKTHKLLGYRGCILCRRGDKFGDSKFCYTCDIATKVLAPVIVPVPTDNETYNNVANQFQKSWRHPTPCPRVQAVFKIVETKNISDKYNAYRNVVEGRGAFTSNGRPAGNQQRRWHGTNRECGLGENGRNSFCYSAQCSLCCIIRASFDLTHSGKKSGSSFGHGIYTSSTSSNSNGYSKNLTASTLKAVLLVYVVVGKAKKIASNQAAVTQPPAGYDSVIAEPATGFLDYDELVVYSEDAVCPAYLVMYDP
ncbi:hypothetical protein BJ322DRAFT_1008547 [Thelephora terrestris]|uniref:PARP catalytic domain-containing protein n=1 Tax=Thelephora terrestris TaxID=56493 RepID=A0A9P6L5F5_9AGAM|nr:hypothetical protein BJ322DRAFT_1008547 [Thelephora terrestris]